MTEPKHKDPRVGTTVFGSFTLVDVLGSGSFASAYLADQVGSDRQAVVKIAHPHLLHDETSQIVRSRFATEFRAMTRINHPNLVTIYMAGDTQSGLPALAMEFVSGETFDELLREQAPLDPVLLKNLFTQLALTLEAVHTVGIVHRDVTPSNIILSHTHDGEMQVKLLDFGIAQLDGLSGSTEGPIGTPRYLAPEQIEGNSTPQSDIFSLGAMLWWALVGQEYLIGITSLAAILKHLLNMKESANPLQYRPDLPLPFSNLLQRMLHPNAAYRPSATRFLEEWKQLFSEIDDKMGSGVRSSVSTQSSDQWSTQGSSPNISGQWGTVGSNPSVSGQWGTAASNPSVSGQWGAVASNPNISGQWSAQGSNSNPQNPQGQWNAQGNPSLQGQWNTQNPNPQNPQGQWNAQGNPSLQGQWNAQNPNPQNPQGQWNSNSNNQGQWNANPNNQGQWNAQNPNPNIQAPWGAQQAPTGANQWGRQQTGMPQSPSHNPSLSGQSPQFDAAPPQSFQRRQSVTKGFQRPTQPAAYSSSSTTYGQHRAAPPGGGFQNTNPTRQISALPPGGLYNREQQPSGAYHSQTGGWAPQTRVPGQNTWGGAQDPSAGGFLRTNAQSGSFARPPFESGAFNPPPGAGSSQHSPPASGSFLSITGLNQPVSGTFPGNPSHQQPLHPLTHEGLDSQSEEFFVAPDQAEVLLIDTSNARIDHLSNALRRQFYSIYIARNATESAEMLDEHTFDVILVVGEALEHSKEKFIAWLRQGLGSQEEGGPGILLLTTHVQRGQQCPEGFDGVVPLSRGIALLCKSISQLIKPVEMEWSNEDDSNNKEELISLGVSNAQLDPQFIQHFIGNMPEWLVQLSESIDTGDHGRRWHLCSLMEEAAQHLKAHALIAQIQKLSQFPPEVGIDTLEVFLDQIEAEYIVVFRDLVK